MKRTEFLLKTGAMIALAVLFVPCSFGQGSLTPPAGPPVPTMKTLDQIEPRTIVNAANTPGDANHTFIISAPGSYYLAANLTGDPGKHGISIQAESVTLDLNGFALISTGGANVRGVDLPSAFSNFCIRNGAIRGWPGGGVRAESGGRGMFAEKLRLEANTGSGGDGYGIYAGLGAMIKDCVATGNTVGFRTPDRCQLSNCIATTNTTNGFDCTSHVTLIDCTASRNDGIGMAVLSHCNIVRCSATRNVLGGISASDSNQIAECLAGFNAADGIVAGSHNAIRNCTATGNTEAGISLRTKNLVTGNKCDRNEAGISFKGYNRIDGNSANDNTQTGFRSYFDTSGDPGAHNLIIRNSVSGSPSPFNTFGNDSKGPIVDMTAGGDITSTSPWANFKY